jgi:hypothetical protein
VGSGPQALGFGLVCHCLLPAACCPLPAACCLLFLTLSQLDCSVFVHGFLNVAHSVGWSADFPGSDVLPESLTGLPQAGAADAHTPERFDHLTQLLSAQTVR